MKIDREMLTHAIEWQRSLDQREKAAAMDKAAEGQPHLFDMVLMQKSLGASLETMDSLLEILLVCSEVTDYAGMQVPTVADETMIGELNRFVTEVGFASNLPPSALTESVVQYRSGHPEPVLFRWALQLLAEAGLTDFNQDQKSALLAGCTIVNCFSRHP